jgi:hypothetical protein
LQNWDRECGTKPVSAVGIFTLFIFHVVEYIECSNNM